MSVGVQNLTNFFFDHPILNSPYSAPSSHWELDEIGQPTQEIIEKRRSAKFVTPIPKPKNRKSSKKQSEIVFDEGRGLSTEGQQYDPTSIINEVRQAVDNWRNLPNQNQWQVTPETERHLLYVACTRARDHLLVSGVNPYSEFLDDLLALGA